MELNPIVKCPICGKPYRAYSMMVGDQSVCGTCRREADNAINAPDTDDTKNRRNRYFNQGAKR